MALWLGLVTTTLAYVLFGIGLGGMAPATVSTLTLAEPLTAGVLGVAILGETLSSGGIAGLLVLAAGIVVLAAGAAARPVPRPAPA
jgi:DME family drug/metabolite transporter